MVKLGIYPEDWAGDVAEFGANFGERSQRGEMMGFAALYPSYETMPNKNAARNWAAF